MSTNVSGKSKLSRRDKEFRDRYFQTQEDGTDRLQTEIKKLLKDAEEKGFVLGPERLSENQRFTEREQQIWLAPSTRSIPKENLLRFVETEKATRNLIKGQERIAYMVMFPASSPTARTSLGQARPVLHPNIVLLDLRMQVKRLNAQRKEMARCCGLLGRDQELEDEDWHEAALSRHLLREALEFYGVPNELEKHLLQRCGRLTDEQWKAFLEDAKVQHIRRAHTRQVQLSFSNALKAAREERMKRKQVLSKDS